MQQQNNKQRNWHKKLKDLCFSVAKHTENNLHPHKHTHSHIRTYIPYNLACKFTNYMN